MHLIDDVDAFLSYPWGVASYEYLVLETHRAKKSLSDNNCEGATLNMDAHGFVTVLQCWLYDILPNLGSKFAEALNPDRIPRILRWSVSSKSIDYHAFRCFFTPSAFEWVMLYMFIKLRHTCINYKKVLQIYSLLAAGSF